MKNKLISILLFGFLIIFGTSCSKYDEGGITTRAENKISKKTWVLDTIINTNNKENGLINHEYIKVNIEFYFNENGEYTQTSIYDTITTIIKGRWELSNKNKSIKITPNIENDSIDYLTRRLNIWSENDTIIETYSSWYNKIKYAGIILSNENTILKLREKEFWFEKTDTIVFPSILGIAPTPITTEIHLKEKK